MQMDDNGRRYQRARNCYRNSIRWTNIRSIRYRSLTRKDEVTATAAPNPKVTRLPLPTVSGKQPRSVHNTTLEKFTGYSRNKSLSARNKNRNNQPSTHRNIKPTL